MAKILIVEDEDFFRHTLASKLVSAGYETIEADNGSAGLDSALSTHPDLIMLDLMIPEMDGLSVLSHLRQDSWGKDVPVIILTNLAESDKIKQAEDMKAQAYIVKANSTLDDMLQLVETELRSQTSSQPTQPTS